MKISKQIMLFAVTLAMSSASVFAQSKEGGVGNGGSSYDCADGVRLIDIEELKVLKGTRGKITFVESNEDPDKQIKRALKKVSDINPYAGVKVQAALNEFLSSLSELEDEYSWGVTSDLGDVPLISGCEIKNVVFYNDAGPVEIKMPLYRRMSPTHKAALYVHEAIYKVIRDNGEKGSSVPARRITGLLFAYDVDQEILKSLLTRFVSVENKQNKEFFEVEEEMRNKPMLIHNGTGSLSIARNSYMFPMKKNGKKKTASGEFLSLTEHLQVGDFAVVEGGGIDNIIIYDREYFDGRRVKTTSVLVSKTKNTVEQKYFGFISSKMKKFLNGIL